MGSRVRLATAGLLLLILVAVVRIVISYSYTALAFDEPCHVAAGIEFLDKKTYALDPVHPPLSRVAIALPIYLAGERFPKLAPGDPGLRNYNVVGNHVLYDSGNFRRNLMLARLGVLPFFVLGAVIVFLWTMRLSGERCALFATLLYTTTPTVLAFSSIAYTDIVAASTQLAALYAFSLCLEGLSRSRTLWLALALGLAFLAKLTSVLFLPAAGFCMFVVWFYLAAKEERANLVQRGLHWLGALGIAAVIVWGGYRFSLKPVQQVTGMTPASMPSFQHFPAFSRPILRKVVVENLRLPAPELLDGISHAYVLNNSGSASYLLGQIKTGGWWYFYLCALGVKLPLPLLIAFVIGAILLIRRKGDFESYFPLAALAGILLITMHVSYQVGLRHILVCLPLMAIVAGVGLKTWLDEFRWSSAAVLGLIVLIVWQVAETARAQSNFLAYFNELAGSDPGKVLSMGCDFDCGQDVYRLADELKARHVPRVTLAVWSSADVDRSDLPPYDLPDGGHKEGWIAVSSRAARIGDVLHQSFPPHSFEWLNQYSPVANVGKTIKLYYVNPTSKP